MKKIILATLAAATMVACAKDDIVVAPKGDAIAFDNAFVDKQTRSIDPSITTGSLTGFEVFATTKGDEANAGVINIFKHLQVSGSAAAGWSYNSDYTQYWIDGNTYKFAAVVNGTVTPDGNGMPSTIDYDATSQNDLLYAENTSYAPYIKATSNKTVAFTFDHILSKIKFSFRNLSPVGGYGYKVTDIKITGVGKSAICDVASYPDYTWTITDTTDAEFGDIVANDNDTEAVLVAPSATFSSKNERLVVPQDYANLIVSCRIATIINGQEADVENYSNTVAVNLEGGKAYNFVLSRELSDEIQFTVVKVNAWDENTVIPGVTVVDESNIEIYSEEGLFWFANQVNSGADTFAGKTVKLVSDITMTRVWTPIGVERADKSFRGTFDGQNHTISNLQVNSVEFAGFFGRNWKSDIKNIKFDNATIIGNHYAGVVVGWADGAQNGGANTGWDVQNCHVTNSTVTLSVANNDNGDKAGGIVGYAYAIDVTGCSVAKTTIQAYRDLGGIVGILNSNTTHAASVSGCTLGADVYLKVDNSVNYNNYTEQSQYNVANYAGRVSGGNATVAADNTGVATIVF